MEFRILGPLEAHSEDGPIPLGGPRQRALLALLLLHANEPLARDLITRLYHLDKPCEPADFERIAEAWRPYRTWATVLVRAAGHRILQTET